MIFFFVWTSFDDDSVTNVRESVEENRSREVEEYVRAIGSSRAGEAARNSSADDLATS